MSDEGGFSWELGVTWRFTLEPGLCYLLDIVCHCRIASVLWLAPHCITLLRHLMQHSSFEIVALVILSLFFIILCLFTN